MSISNENNTEIERPQTAEKGSMTFKHTDRRKRMYDIQTHTHRRKRKYDIQTHKQIKEEV